VLWPLGCCPVKRRTSLKKRTKDPGRPGKTIKRKHHTNEKKGKNKTGGGKEIKLLRTKEGRVLKTWDKAPTECEQGRAKGGAKRQDRNREPPKRQVPANNEV